MARRSLAKCPKALSKYGFCGLLAVIYAAKLEMPANLTQLQAFFGEVKRICAMDSSKWRNALPKKQGGISFAHTVCLLQHYKGCEFEEVHTPVDAPKTNLSTWLKRSVLANSCYIVHVGKHAFFVDVGKSKGKWRIYDQRGPRSKKDLKTMSTKGGYGRKLVTRVLKIAECV
jgi:hypothetical protein